ncbi:MAG: hypothetical protein AAF390_08190 [Pseudomonadota bacterium]
MIEPSPRAAVHVLLGAAVVATGAAVALTLPPALTGVGLLILLLRVCWLEDNIKSDLMGTDTMPANHARPLRDRAALLGGGPGIDDPALMATALRGQIQALGAGGLGAVAILAAGHLTWPPAAALALGLALVWLAFRRVDRLSVTLAHLERGRPLSRRALSDAHPWAHSHRIEDD